MAAAALAVLALAAAAGGCSPDGPATVGPVETRVGDVQVVIETDPAPPVSRRELRFRATLTDADGKPVEDAGVALTLIMPEMNHGEQVIRLTHTGGGVYEGTAILVMPGRWVADIRVARRGERARGRVEFHAPR